MTLTGMLMLSNTAEDEGGAVFALKGGRLTGGHLENNSAVDGYGGGMAMDSAPSYPTGFLDLSGTISSATVLMMAAVCTSTSRR